jgi:N-acetyl-alpha-D-glucosaminyl L-malate synthase BshA
MAEVTRDAGLDVLHAHYAVPHATAAVLARSMLPVHLRPAVVTTLHGTDTTLLGRDPGYGPAIAHALAGSDAVTTVSAYLEGETRRLLKVTRPIDVIHNFFTPRPPRRPPGDVRRELGLGPDELVVLHMSNLRPGKRVDLVLEVAARIRPRDAFKLLILAGDSFDRYWPDVRRLGLEDRIFVRERVADVEDYLQVADLGLFTSENESFCLSILEAMCFGRPSVAPRVGGIPEVTEDGATGVLVPFGDVEAMAAAASTLLADATRRGRMGEAARDRAATRFSADAVIPLYESLYRRVRNLARGAGR